MISFYNDSLGHRIKAQRLNMGLTQEQLAEVMCVPKSTISAYENDKVDIKSSIIIELSKNLSTTPDFLLGTKEDRYVTEIVSLISKIKAEKTLEMLIIQIRALAELQNY